MQTKPKIYTLSTAINRYPYIRPLHGCINDANNFKQYIEAAAKAQNREVITKELHNKAATKANIVEAFAEHLGLATEEDTCLFYFSGHGGQEEAHPAFEKHESDGKLEVLACYDSKLSKQGSFLADKELRYLIHQLYQKTKAQIITIFDCCHSGGNAKNPLLTPRRLMNDAEGRKWEDFIFASPSITAEAVAKAKALQDILPQGNFLHLAACEDKESAYEVGGQGIFTSNLVDLLQQSKGKINYQNLISILGLKITGKKFPQRPQVYAYGDDKAIFHSFLGSITEHQKHHANLVFNTQSKAWFVDRGAIHGIQKENPDLSIEVVDTDGKALQKAHIVAVQPNKTQVDFEDTDSLKEDNVYTVHISGWRANTLQVYLSGEQAGLDAWNEHWEEINQSASSLKMVDSPEIADYWVEAKDNTYHIYHPFEDSRPLTQSIEGYQQSGVLHLMDYLDNIAHWTSLQNLDNPHTKLQPNPPIDLQVFVKQKGGEIEVPIEEGKAVLEYTQIPQPKSLEDSPSLELGIRLHNPSDRSYYCAVLYLSQDFGIEPQVLEGNTVELLAGKEVWAFGGQYIPDEQSPYIRHYNWEAETHHLKLIVSTHSFDVTSLTQEGLPAPETGLGGTMVNKKLLKFHKLPYLEDWTTHLVELKVVNPYVVAFNMNS